MYKLLIVDDEKFEREGMAAFIDWNRFDIEVVGTAWNGQEGYEKVKVLHPDIVLTDIKMPVMDGLGLISKLKEEYPDIEIVVLSGYGEYEYTSQAMEYGIKYYVLKPCDEGRIIPIMDKVKAEIEIKQRGKHIKKLIPLAKEQMFRNILLNRETTQREYQVFIEEIKKNADSVRLLVFRNPLRRFDALEQFVIENVLTELYGHEEVFLETSISEDVLFLIDDNDIPEIEKSVERICREFARLSTQSIQAALSDAGEIEKASELYTQVQELFHLGEVSERKGLLHSGMFSSYQESSAGFFRYRELRKAEDYADVLFEVYLAFLKMQFKEMQFERKREICSLAYQIICQEKKASSGYDWSSIEMDDWNLICTITDLIAQQKGIDTTSGKEQIRMKQIIQAIYQNFQNTELSIRYLAKEVLYMNEEHFGRVFMRSRNQKFSTWLRQIRIELAKEMLVYAPEIKVSALAEMVGYSPDGQYFSKAFRTETGRTPTEYCEQFKEKKNDI